MTWSQWFAALLAAAAVHVLLAFAVIVLAPERQPTPPSTRSVEVSLAPLGDAPTATLPAPEAAPTVAAEASSGEAPTTAPAPVLAPEASAPEPSVSAQTEPETAEQSAPDSPTRQAEVAETEHIAPETAGPVVVPELVDPVTVSPADTAAEPAESVTAESPSDQVVQARDADAEGSDEPSGSQDGVQAGGRADETDEYVSRVRSWLARNRSYPRKAHELQYEGVVRVRFAINREGEVLEYKIIESSGHDLLDREVESLIERAQPLPSIPEGLRRTRMDLIVPIRFTLQ